MLYKNSLLILESVRLICPSNVHAAGKNTNTTMLNPSQSQGPKKGVIGKFLSAVQLIPRRTATKPNPRKLRESKSTELRHLDKNKQIDHFFMESNKNSPLSEVDVIMAIVMALRQLNLGVILTEKLQTAEGESYFSIRYFVFLIRINLLAEEVCTIIKTAVDRRLVRFGFDSGAARFLSDAARLLTGTATGGILPKEADKIDKKNDCMLLSFPPCTNIC